MGNLSIYDLMSSLHGCEAELLSFALNHPGDDKKAFAVDDQYHAGAVVRCMAVSDPSAFARMVGRYVAFCVASGKIDDDVLQKESSWQRSLKAAIEKKAGEIDAARSGEPDGSDGLFSNDGQ